MWEAVLRTGADGQAAGATVRLCWSLRMCPRSWRAPGGHLEASLRSLWSNSEGLNLPHTIRSASVTGCSCRPGVAELASLVKTRADSGKDTYEGKALVTKQSLGRDLPPRKMHGGREAREKMPRAVKPSGSGNPSLCEGTWHPQAGRKGRAGW